MKLSIFAVIASFCVALGTTEPTKFAGGLHPVDESNQVVNEAAQFAVNYINRQSNSIFPEILVQVEDVQQQVVSGTMFKFLLRTGVSSACRNNGEEYLLEQCPLDDSAKTTMNEVDVWFRPWVTPKMKVTRWKKITA